MNYNISISQADLPYVIEAIGLRAMTIQESIRAQVRAEEEARIRKADEERRAALPDPFDDKPIIVPPTFKEVVETSKAQTIHADAVAKPSRKEKRAALMRVLKSKGAADLTTAEIARRAGVSYVTAMKARAELAPKKGRK